MGITRFGALALGATLAATMAAGEADGPAHVDVGITAATADAAKVTVEGTLDFGGTSEVATDPTGDVNYQQDIGTDLSHATIARDGMDVVFTVGIADGIPVLGGVPDAVQYGWDFVIGDTTYSLTAWRHAAAQRRSADPYHALQTCVPNETTGGTSCSGTAVTGTFTETEITWRVPWLLLRFSQGDVLETAFAPIHATVGAAGAVWYPPGTFSHDDMNYFTDFALGGAVLVELVDADGNVVATRSAAASSTGAWSAAFDGVATGSYTLRATSVYGVNDPADQSFPTQDTDSATVTVG